MKITEKYILTIFFLLGCSGQKPGPPSDRMKAEAIIHKMDSIYNPDRRTHIFNVKPVERQQTLVLKGETDLPDLKSRLFGALDSSGIRYLDSLLVLPDKKVVSTPYAVVKISVANLRKTPNHASELVTQGLMGSPYKVLKEKNGWYLVVGPDHYNGWADNGGIKLFSPDAYKDFEHAEKVICTSLTGTVWSEGGKSSDPVSDLVAGDIMLLTGLSGKYYHVTLPDGRTGYVESGDCRLFSQFAGNVKADPASLVSTSRILLGIPYLWGGTSVKGMDCSGLTKTVYFLNGIILPRDADQQARVGKTVDFRKDFRSLKPGDLLFFGQKAGKGPEDEITHVAMWIGDMRYIQSSGRVKINSMDSTAQDFDRYNFNRYVQANRILGFENQPVISLSDFFMDLP